MKTHLIFNSENSKILKILILTRKNVLYKEKNVKRFMWNDNFIQKKSCESLTLKNPLLYTILVVIVRRLNKK